MDNDSGMLTEEEWLGYISLKAQFNEIFGNNDMNQKLLKKNLKYDENNGLFYWVSNFHKSKIGQVAGYKMKNGYIMIGISGVGYLAHRLAWLYVNGKFPKDKIDHINGVRDDNRIANLREATQAENLQNQSKPRITNKSGYLGVSWRKSEKKYIAQIRVNGKKTKIGLFDDPKDAHLAYVEAKRKHHKYCTI
jgi:hypothetical protein